MATVLQCDQWADGSAIGLIVCTSVMVEQICLEAESELHQRDADTDEFAI